MKEYYPKCYVNGEGNEIYLTIDGKKQEQPISKYPYAYLRYCIYENGWQKSDKMLYSDRLPMWYKNYDEVAKEIGISGQNFSNFAPEQIEELLSTLMKKEITFTGMEEECNVSNGFPYYVIYYREK